MDGKENTEFINEGVTVEHIFSFLVGWFKVLLFLFLLTILPDEISNFYDVNLVKMPLQNCHFL